MRHECPLMGLRKAKEIKPRGYYVGKEWEYPGDQDCERGMFKIGKKGTGSRAQDFLCKRVGETNPKKANVWFPVAYCIERFHH